MSKKTYDNRTINVFPEELKITLPDGYRMDIEYDEDGEQIVNLRGGFSFNEDGEEVASFSAVFIRLNSEINDRQKAVEDGTLMDYFVPGLMLKQVADGVFDNLTGQLGPGKRFDMFGSFPASSIMKFYKPISIFGVNIETYIVRFLIEITENVHFGFQSVYQNSEEGNREFFKHVLNIMKSFRVNGEALDTGKLTPKKLEQVLDMEIDIDVEALDLGISIGINFQNGDEETHYTINSDGSITEDYSDSGYYDPYTSDEPHYDQSVLDGPIDTLRIGDSYDPEFLLEHGKDITRIVASGYGYVNYITMASCPNVEEFIVRKNSEFSFEDGVLYSKKGNKRTIEYITKNVEHLHIDADVSDISSYWHGVKKVTVDPGNGNFVAQGNMLLSRRKNSLYFVTSDAEEVIIPEGVTQIHARAIEYCDKLKKISFPSTYEWKEWYGSHSEPLLFTRDGMKPPKVIVNGDNIKCENGLVLRYPDTRPSAVLYLGDYESCYIPAKLTSTFGFDSTFKKVKSFTVDKNNPALASVDGVILDKSKTTLLFYPPARDEFIIPATVKEIASHSAASRDFTEIVIPEHVQKVGQMAFANCSRLKSVKTLNPKTETHKEAYFGCQLLNGDSMFEPVNEDELKKSLAEEIWDINHSQDREDSFGGLFGWQQEEVQEEVRVSDDNNRTVIVDNKWAFDLPDGVYLRFDSEHVDIMGNSTTAKYVVEGLEYNGRFFFDFDLHERFEDGMSTDVDVIGCRHDNDVISGNAQQKIIADGDDLFVDLVSKPILFFNSMAMIRVRGDGIRSWDFTAGLSSTDQEMSARWEEVQGLMKELAGSIRLLDSAASSAKKKKSKKEEPVSDPDLIISNGVLRKYIGKSNDVVIPDGVKEIADSTFSGFSNLKSVVVPEGVKRIGRRCFENCSSLEHAYLPESLEELGGYAFVDCHELKEVYLSEKLKVLGDSAFSECFKLKDVKIPKNIDIIDAFVFKNCREFRHIVIPDKVTKIGFSAFVACTNLEYLFVPESVKECQINITSHPFEASEKLTIYTPAGSYMQKFAEENGIPYKIADKGTVTADNSKAKSKELEGKPAAGTAGTRAASGFSRQTGSKGSSAWTFPVADTSKVKTKLLSNKTGYAAGFLSAADVLKDPDDSKDFYRYILLNERYYDKLEDMIDLADRCCAKVMSEEESSEIKRGLLRTTAPMHALRSFIWTAIKMNDIRIEDFIAAAPGEMWLELAQFVYGKGYVNYTPRDARNKLYGYALLKGVEVRSVYYYQREVYNSPEHYTDPEIGKTMTNATNNSVFDAIDVLIDFIPAIEALFDGYSDSDNSQISGIKQIIMGWCLYAYACRSTFYVVPGEKIGKRIIESDRTVWSDRPEIRELENGRFRAIGTEIIGINDRREVLVIPEGITKINTAYLQDNNIRNDTERAKKVIYPRSFIGTVLVPYSAAEIDILGNFDILKCSYGGRYISDYQNYALKRFNILGSVRRYDSDGVLYNCYNLNELTFPEGLEEIGRYAFTFVKNRLTVRLPESLQKVGDEAFGSKVKVIVYSTCPALSAIRELRNTNNYYDKFELSIIDPPWPSISRDFVNRIKPLYRNSESDNLYTSVDTIVKDAFSDKKILTNCRKAVANEAAKVGLSGLRNIMLSDYSDDEFCENVTALITEDIEKSIEEEKQKRYDEAVNLSSGDKLANLIKAESVFIELGGFKDSKDLLKQVSASIEAKKSSQYDEAVSLFSEGSEDSILKAIEKLDELGQYKDAKDLSKEYLGYLKKERAYQDVVKVIESEDLNELRDAKAKLEGLAGFKNADEMLVSCSSKLEAIMSEMYDEAISLAEQQTEESLTDARAIMSSLKPYRDSESKIEELNDLIPKEKTYQAAAKEMTKESLVALKTAKEMFSAIEGYKDSAERVSECENRAEAFCKYNYVKARKAEKVLTVESQRAAISLYRLLEGYDDSSDRLQTCQKNTDLIKDVLTLEKILIGAKEVAAKIRNASSRKVYEEYINKATKDLDDKKQQLAAAVGVETVEVSYAGLLDNERVKIENDAERIQKDLEATSQKNYKLPLGRRVASIICLLGGIAAFIFEILWYGAFKQSFAGESIDIAIYMLLVLPVFLAILLILGWITLRQEASDKMRKIVGNISLICTVCTGIMLAFFCVQYGKVIGAYQIIQVVVAGSFILVVAFFVLWRRMKKNRK